MKKIFVPLFVLLFTISIHAQQDFSQVQIKATKVSGNVYMLEGSVVGQSVSKTEPGKLLVFFVTDRNVPPVLPPQQ